MVYMDYMDAHDVLVSEDLQKEQEFKHDLGCGLPLFLCCRQVYHEAAGVIYGGNTFAISRALHRHDTGRDDWRFDQDPAYHQFSYASEWLLEIGSQLALLRKVWIDTGATCPPNCAHANTHIDLLPLLRVL